MVHKKPIKQHKDMPMSRPERTYVQISHAILKHFFFKFMHDTYRRNRLEKVYIALTQ